MVEVSKFTETTSEAGASLGIYAKSASPASVDEKLRLLRADRYRHLAVARDLSNDSKSSMGMFTVF